MRSLSTTIEWRCQGGDLPRMSLCPITRSSANNSFITTVTFKERSMTSKVEGDPKEIAIKKDTDDLRSADRRKGHSFRNEVGEPTGTALGHHFGALDRRGRRGRRRGRGGTPGNELAQLRLERAPIGEVVEPRAFDRREADGGEERQALHH